MEIKNMKTKHTNLQDTAIKDIETKDTEIKDTEIKAAKIKNAVRFETCVCCHKQLPIPVDEPIDYRAFYVEGAGQLCYDCYHKIYK